MKIYVLLGWAVLKGVLAQTDEDSTTTSSSSSPARSAEIDRTLTYTMRGDDEVQIYDSWGDYKFHDSIRIWQPYEPKFHYPNMRGWLQRQGLWGKVESYDEQNDPNFGSTEPSDGTTKLTRFWVDSLWADKDIPLPAIAGSPFVADASGYDIPLDWQFQHRKFNRTESTFAIKYWMMKTSTPDCTALVAQACPGATENGKTLISDNDPGIADCLKQLPVSCKVVISGYANFTEPHAPDVCCSNALAMTLPTPGKIVPLEHCQYGDIIVHNFIPLAGLRDSYYSDRQWLNAEYLHGLGAQPPDPWSNPLCVNAASEPYARGCQARIEFGNNLFTTRDSPPNVITNSTDQGRNVTQPSFVCYPPDFHRGMILVAKEDYLFYPSEYPILQSDYGGNKTQNMMDAGRMNMLVKIERLRIRNGDRRLSAFTMQISGSDFFDWCGSFTGIEVPMKCNTHGMKNFYSAPETELDWAESNQNA